MQYHYVVTYDSLDKTFSVDVDTSYLVFEDGFFFDTEKQKWIDSDDERLPFYAEDYLEVEEQLALTLTIGKK